MVKCVNCNETVVKVDMPGGGWIESIWLHANTASPECHCSLPLVNFSAIPMLDEFDYDVVMTVYFNDSRPILRVAGVEQEAEIQIAAMQDPDNHIYFFATLGTDV